MLAGEQVSVMKWSGTGASPRDTWVDVSLTFLRSRVATLYFILALTESHGSQLRATAWR